MSRPGPKHPFALAKYLAFVALALVAGKMLAQSKSSSRRPAAPGEIRGKPISASPAAASTEAKPVSVALVSTPAPVPLASLPQPARTDPEPFPAVGFDRLASFVFEMPADMVSPGQPDPATAKNQIPPLIKALDQKPVCLKGFMLPLKIVNGLVTEMLIMRDQSMCCYGTVPKITEWVSVKMDGKGVKPVMDQPVKLFGKLHVGELRENGYLVGIYSLDGQKMTTPEEEPAPPLIANTKP